MKKIIIAISALWLSTNLISQNTMTYEEKISYIIGYNIGQQMAQDSFAFSSEAIHKGIKLALSKGKIEFTDQEMQQTMQEWQQKMQADMQNRTKTELDKNKTEGAAFLERNKQNEGVKVTASGLQYKVERMGDGVKPTSANDKVSAHYEGTLLDGTVFDSSYKRGEPMTFALNQVIKGWTEGLQLMPVGSKFIFYIPSELGYGDTASGPIPAGATLIFTVELFGVNQ